MAPVVPRTDALASRTTRTPFAPWRGDFPGQDLPSVDRWYCIRSELLEILLHLGSYFALTRLGLLFEPVQVSIVLVAGMYRAEIHISIPLP